MKYLDMLIRMLSICKYGLIVGYLYAAAVLVYRDYDLQTLLWVSGAYLLAITMFAYFERQLKQRYDSIAAKIENSRRPS